MKKINFLIAFAISSIGFSQTILNQSETSSRTVQDPQTVIMLPGFHASSATASPFVAKIGDNGEGGGTTDSGAGTTNPSGTLGNNSFHDTQGNIEVNGGGQLQFTLPIALPPGVKSVAPQINLVYTSGSGNGIAGYGWNLSGITSISRVGKTIERDGELKGVQLDYSDYYSFNGQRLILKSGEYGKDGAEYVTEKYSNVKIQSFGTVFSQIWQGPEYWLATFEDGSQAWYGATKSGDSNARSPIEYNIVKWKDAQGNYITYNYTQSNNVAVVSSIQWGGNETISNAHFNQIVFNYATRDLKEQSYVNGINFIQDKILSNVVVNANNLQFKKYLIQYKKGQEGTSYGGTISYDFVGSIQEFNANNEPANPTIFSTNQPYTSYTTQSYGNYDSIIASGDYDGDGYLDYIIKQPAQNNKQEGYYVVFNALSSNNSLFIGNKATYDNYSFHTVTIKPSNNIVSSKQGVLLIKKTDSNSTITEDIKLDYYLIDKSDIAAPLKLQYTKTILASTYEFNDSLYTIIPTSYNYDDETKSSILKFPQEIDVDSDGISELVFSVEDYKNYHYTVEERDEYCGCTITNQFWENMHLGTRYFLIDNDDLSSNTIHVITALQSKTNILSKSRILDFDKNGKIDIMFAESTNNKTDVSYYTKNALSDVAYLKKVNTPLNNLYQYEISKQENNYSLSLKNNFTIKGFIEQLIYGDLNGDGNVEVLAPISKNDTSLYDGWAIYLNNGKNLSEFCQGLTNYYKTTSPTSYYQDGNYIDLIDIDEDGKTELINFYSGYNFVNNYSNIMLYKHFEFQYNESDTRFRWSSKYQTLFKDLKGGDVVQPIFGNFKYGSRYSNVIFLSKSLSDATLRKVISFNHYSLSIDKNINSITQGSLLTQVDYGKTVSNYTYFPIKKEKYPYVEIENFEPNLLVERISQSITVNGYTKIRKQDFRYRGFITHLQGKGMIGFRQTARSSWYNDDFLNTKIWIGAEIDPINEGLPIKEWSIKTTDESSIFPSDISLNNTQLLSYKDYKYKIEKLLNGTIVTSYTDADKPKIVTSIYPYIITSKDFQKDIKTVHTVERYSSIYLPEKSTTNINDGFAITTTELAYNTPNYTVGSNYAIGKPAWKTETMQVYGDTKGGKEEYEYNGNLLTKKRTYNRDYNNSNAQYIEERYVYDGFGNVIEKTIEDPYNNDDVQAATTKSQYEDKGRFVIKKTDNLGLETNITYNNWGQVLTQTDHLNNTLTNTYDSWGKLLTSKTNLGGTTTYTYEKLSNGDSKVTEYSPDNDQKITYTNKLGQNYKSSVKGFADNSYVSQEVQFDVLGRKIKESEPYLEGTSASKWNVTDYDDYSRPIKITQYTGKITTSSYSGRTVTATETNANNRFKTQVFDAIGNVTSTTDKGGTIEFKYNAAGENIQSKFDKNIVTTQYDKWGRKSLFNDPSNGIYQYEYNGYGQLIHTTSPKGHKYYNYDEYGRLYNQTETSNDGTSTNKNITLVYNNKGLITNKNGTSNGKAYSSYVNYDANGRVISSGENSNGRYFYKKAITYDDKGRITSYEKGMLSSGVNTKTVLENRYSNWSGEMYQLKDKNSSKVLWELTETNAKGQVLKAKLGASSIENTYDANNFLSNVSHTTIVNGTTNTALQVAYSFNAIKNELNSRATGGNFNIIEAFTYDDNNRLVNWTNPKTGQLSNNVYDAKGRIIENDQLGTIKYDDNSTTIYRPTGATLNAAGQQNLTNDLIQSITYNENNDPIKIEGEKGDVYFAYGLTNMRQAVGYGGKLDGIDEGHYTKYYSEDGSYEVVIDNTTGKEKHIMYIGGTPYEANIVYLKNYTESSGSYKFLHKDYLGSILAITDEDGNIKEQRHFDAWGNLTHYKVNGVTKNVNEFNNLSLIDRGYTSHEHFTEVGIIHMNGRLYDPLLRRFLNADENIQDPNNTQNYNKYGYVMNNPLMYNDPSGEFFQFILMAAFWKAVLIGAFVGVASAVITAGITGRQISAGGILKSAFIGAISGAVTFGIGSIFNVAGEAGKLTQFAEGLKKSVGGLGLELIRGGLHAASQGLMSLVQGGDFMSAAAGGFFGSLGASGFGAIAGDWAGNASGQIFFGALAGGVGAELTGGNFWQGAIIGGMVAGLNHAMHQMSGPGDDELIKKLTPEQRKQLEQIKSGTQLTTEALQKTGLDKVLDNWIENTALGKNLKVGVVDYLSMGGEIYYDHKLQQYNGISKNEFTFRFVTKAASGLTSAHFGSLAGAAVGAEYGATVGGLVGTVVGAGIGFYIENTYWRGIKYFDNFMTRFGGYIQRQAIFNARRGF